MKLESEDLMIRTLLKTHGGKGYLAKEIFEKLHHVLGSCSRISELYGGGASFLLQLPRYGIRELYNDLDFLTMNAYRIARDTPGSLQCELQKVRCDSKQMMEWEFCRAKDIVADQDSYNLLDLAVATIVIRRMSRGGMGKDFAWSNRDRGGEPGDMHSWRTFVHENVPFICERVANWDIECTNALNLIIDSPTYFFYLDPPYHPVTRMAPAVYGKEMSIKDHEKLLERIQYCPAKIAISGYSHPSYENKLNRWRRIVFRIKNHSSQQDTKETKEEILWTNFS